MTTGIPDDHGEQAADELTAEAAAAERAERRSGRTRTVAAAIAVVAVAVTALVLVLANRGGDRDPADSAGSSSGAPTSAAGTSAEGMSATYSASAPSASTTAQVQQVAGTANLTGLNGKVSGAAELVANADGSYTVRLESYEVPSGKGLEVYLVPEEDATVPEVGQKLGTLSESSGSAEYPLDQTATTLAQQALDNDYPLTVLIWSPEGIGVANATVLGGS